MPTPRPVSLRKTLYRSSISADDDTSSCDEIVDMIAAREKIVEGAVTMVQDALNQLEAADVVVLDDERRAAMV